LLRTISAPQDHSRFLLIEFGEREARSTGLPASMERICAVVCVRAKVDVARARRAIARVPDKRAGRHVLKHSQRPRDAMRLPRLSRELEDAVSITISACRPQPAPT